MVFMISTRKTTTAIPHASSIVVGNHVAGIGTISHMIPDDMEETDCHDPVPFTMLCVMYGWEYSDWMRKVDSTL